jgi:hypothetical protein
VPPYCARFHRYDTRWLSHLVMASTVLACSALIERAMTRWTAAVGGPEGISAEGGRKRATDETATAARALVALCSHSRSL